MKHHYVPQFLLQGWAESTSDQKVEIFRLDLPHLPSSRHRPEYTGYEKNLYALTLPVVAGMEQQAVEKHFLRHIDNLAARVLRKLGRTGLADLTPEDRSDWTRFLMSLRVRQPGIVHYLRAQASEQLQAALADSPKEYDAAAGDGDPPTLIEWTNKNYPGLIENFGMSFFHELVDNHEVGEKILQMRWSLWDFTREQHDLLLSDNPCIFTEGIDDPNLVIALPIGPRQAFIATKSGHGADILRHQRPKDLLVRMNESALQQARPRIYARDTSPRQFICNRMISWALGDQQLTHP